MTRHAASFSAPQRALAPRSRQSAQSADPFPLPRHFPHVVGPVIQCLALRAIHLPSASQRHRSPGETRWSIKKFHIW